MPLFRLCDLNSRPLQLLVFWHKCQQTSRQHTSATSARPACGEMAQFKRWVFCHFGPCMHFFFQPSNLGTAWVPWYIRTFCYSVDRVLFEYSTVLLYVSHKLRLLDGARRPIFLMNVLHMKIAARTSCRSQLVRAAIFVFSRRIEKSGRLAPSRESTLFL